VKHLVLYHTEDATLANRRTAYSAEAAQNFTGTIHVPNDGEILLLE
jgi:ribonuclease Z